LRLLRHEINRGRGAARRTGQDATDSPWIGFVDADIVVPPNWLNRCLEELSDVDGVSGIAQPDGDCAVIWRVCQPTIRQRPGSAEITGNNVLFSRDALKRVPFSPNAKLGEDFRLAKLMTREGFRLRTVEDLKVEHRESKTYWRAVTWMWQSGVDATSLLFEFRIFRMPDLAWLTWFTVFIVTMAAGGLGVLGLGFSIVAIVAMTLVVDALFIYSRFTPRPHLIRFLAALAISPPMMLAYLVGRTAGLLRLPYLLLHSSVTNTNQ
jgi:cellulose synthase/poly-beta-1,6-N-acetylglucosamine synthase-like glycosyltransferase